MGKPKIPSPPPPPDPNVVAAAQTGSNVTTGISNSFLGNANQYTPYGSTQFAVDHYNTVTDPTSGKEYQIPTFNQTQTLSPEQQQLLNQQEALGFKLNDTAYAQLSKIGDLLGQPVNAPSGSLQSNVAAGPIQTSLKQDMAPTTFGNTTSSINFNSPTSFGNTAQGINYNYKTDLGPQDWSADRQKVEDAIYSRLNPQLERDRAQLDTKLANEGFVRGTDAYNQAMDEYNRQANDARMAAILAGGQEQSRLFGLDLAQGNFYNTGVGLQNAAQMQDYSQLLGRGQFAQAGIGQNNAANQQEYGQLLGRGTFAQQGTAQNNQSYLNQGNFANAAQNQGFNQGMSNAQLNNQSYAQQLQTMLALRNQPINEISALMNGGQVTLPQFQGYQSGQVAGTPVGDYYYQTAQLQNQQYLAQLQAAQQAQSGLYGGIGSVLGAGLYGLGKFGMFSDRRIKTDIKRIGEWINGLPLYLFRYIGQPLLHIGFMAQDVEKVMPEAVAELNGIKVVNYALAMRAN